MLSAPSLGWHAAIAFIAIAVIFAVVAARRPSYGIAGLLVVDPFAYYHYIGPTTITFPKAALIGFVVGILFRGVAFRALFDRTPRALLVGMVAIIVATALSAFDAYFLAPLLRELLKAIAYLVLFAATLLGFMDDPDEVPIWCALIAITGIVAVLALGEEFATAPSYVSIGNHLIARIAGPLEGPNQLSAYLGITIPLLLAAILGPIRASRSAGELRVAASAALVVALVADVLTFSRAGFLSMIPACLIVVAFLRPRALVGSIGAVVLLGVAALVASRFVSPLSHFFTAREINTPSGLGTRTQLWRAAIVLWKTNPVLGVGAGNYEFDLPRVGLNSVHTHANSLFLQSLAEGGIPMVAAWLWTIYASIATFVSTAARSAIVAGTLAASAGLAIHEIFDLLTFFPKVGDPWWTLLAVAAASSALIKRDALAGPLPQPA